MNWNKHSIIAFIAAVFILSLWSLSKSQTPSYDLVLRNGTIYDGSGSSPKNGDVAIRGDRIAMVGRVAQNSGVREIDVSGLAVSPGFINMLSWANESLIIDGRSESDLRQGVTLEVFGEGSSMGPLSPEMKKRMAERQSDFRYDISWTRLSEYLDYLVRRGVSTNVASFVGATTIRIHEIGYENRPATNEELARMKSLVRQAMLDGALGIGSALIYAPGSFASTEELIELCKVAAEYNGMYISHIRDEGSKLLEAVEELIRISREAKIRAEIYHIKASGKPNWNKLDEVIRKVEEARAEGLGITADMYLYPASATGLEVLMPLWVQEGGHDAWVKRLKDPEIRKRLVKEMTEDWRIRGRDPEKTLLVEFRNKNLRPFIGKTLAEIAAMRKRSPQETAMDLVIEDDSRCGAIYFTMSEENVKKEVAVPWVSFGSDEASLRPAGIFLESNPHPRAYGNFARLLAKYVRDEKVVPLEEAIRRLTLFPATNLRIAGRGLLKSGYFADIVVFDPAKIQDHATYEKPHQFATGVRHVFVNGIQVLNDGAHTGKTPGRVVKGPGARNTM